ncbi:MAG: hypothetical protein PHR68_05060 [Candidatus Gracilibacteria bacterium]|nr:hypothetical protein [Candidatus Gracilibacteria bacterium]
MQINDIIGNRIRHKDLEEQTIKSILWKTIIDEYKIKKNIDISSYLISISISGSTIFIKTNKPLINKEISLIENIILEKFFGKLKKIGINRYDFEIRYL